jgi:hypothetical protein
MEARAQLHVVPLRAVALFFAVVLALTLAAGAGYVVRSLQPASGISVSAPAQNAPAEPPSGIKIKHS